MKKYLIIYNAYITAGNPWFIEYKHSEMSTFSDVVKATSKEEAQNKFQRSNKGLNWRVEIVEISEV
jgi:hypothetical protein